MASTGIDNAIERGKDAVRRLDAIVKNKFSNDPILLSAWARAKHVERAPRPAVSPNTSELAKAGCQARLQRVVRVRHEVE